MSEQVFIINTDPSMACCGENRSQCTCPPFDPTHNVAPEVPPADLVPLLSPVYNFANPLQPKGQGQAPNDTPTINGEPALTSPVYTWVNPVAGARKV